MSDFQHKTTTAIAKRYARTGVESLNVPVMIRNRTLNKAIADVGMSRFISMLRYKSELHGAELVSVDR
ncbi:MAG: IS200/IS605 family element transposase accessory protein TnpB [Chloroflexi bacterium]|nr:IS200/IS605 family element transposase accessory protein TnpB [Chloroflexota bacterium]